MAFYGHSANYIIKISMKNMNKLILNILAVTHTIIYYTYTGYQQKLLDFLNFFFWGGEVTCYGLLIVAESLICKSMQDFCKRKGAYIVLNLSFSSSNSNDGPTFVYLRLVTICCTDTKVGTQLHIEA